LETLTASITDSNGVTKEHVIINEVIYKERCYWEPEVYNIRNASQLDRFKLADNVIELKPDSPEWNLISDYFYLTMPRKKGDKRINNIKSITRYVSTTITTNYKTKLKEARNMHAGDRDFGDSLEYEMLLWHGTGGTDPRIIANGGWKINYASDKNLWGRGTYFASDAAYSSTYAYQDSKTGHKKMFLAKVITGLGLQVMENKNIKDHPNGYNSVVGWRHGSWIYIVYDNALACPWYLIEWAEK